jgi:hypothetical protein
MGTTVNSDRPKRMNRTSLTPEPCTRGICSQLKIVHHLKCGAAHSSCENTSGSDGYVDDLQSNRPSECKTHCAPSRRYGLCCFRFEDPGVQRSAQRNANAWRHPEQPQLPKSRCQLATGCIQNQGTVIFASAYPTVCERRFNSLRLKRSG